MVSESENGCIYNLEIYTSEERKLQETILSSYNLILVHGTIVAKTVITTVCLHLKYWKIKPEFLGL